MGTIPYVVDFPGTRSTERVQRPVPRPFYCTWYQERFVRTLENLYVDSDERIEPAKPDQNGYGAGAFGFDALTGSGHAWYFYKFPDTATIFFSQLYDTSAWN